MVGLALIVLALVPGLMAWFGGGNSSRTFADLRAGDCIRLSVLEGGNAGTPLASVEVVHQQVPCDAPGTISYEVGTVGPGTQSCPNAFYLDYFTTGVDNPENHPREFTACLVPNFTPGICVSDDPDTHGYVVATCTTDALFRVAEVHDLDDPEVCTDGARPMEFPVPARTYCLEEVR